MAEVKDRSRPLAIPLPREQVGTRAPTHPKGTVGMISLGCPKNLVDSEIMLGTLRDQGYQVVADGEHADTIIINTCGFIDEAKEESVETILEMVERKGRDGGPRRVLVAGCMVNRYGQELKAEIPEIDGFIGLDDLLDVPRRLELAQPSPSGATRAGTRERATTPSSEADSHLIQLGTDGAISAPYVPTQTASHVVFDHTAPRLLTTRGYAYLKVAEGCNNPCTFCAIPVWRGRFRSRTIDSLVQEAQRLESQGVQEINLLAQDTTRYGEDLDYGKHGLLRLVEALLERTEVPWIRFLYAYPTTLHRELLALMGQEQRFCSYLDMPLQHSHPEILKAMRRGGSPQRYRRLLDQARELAPDVFLRTTYIVGFPGETEEHFEHLLDFVSEARFDHLGVFLYSPEQDTPSSQLVGRPSKSVARERRRRLMEVQAPIGRDSRERMVGRVLPMLLEGECKETELLLEARHHGMAPDIDGRVLINDGMAPFGSFVDVELTEAHGEDMIGRIVGPRGAPGVSVAPA